MTKIDNNNVWKIIKDLRKAILIDSQKYDYDCNREQTWLDYKIIRENINSLADKLELGRISTKPKDFVYHEDLKTAAKMYTYINYCPNYIKPNLLKLLRFNSILFESGTIKEIVLTLTNIIKTSQNADEKEKAVRIFEYIMKSLRLNQYEKVQMLTKGKCYTNATLENCTNSNHEYLQPTSIV